MPFRAFQEEFPAVAIDSYVSDWSSAQHTVGRPFPGGAIVYVSCLGLSTVTLLGSMQQGILFFKLTRLLVQLPHCL